MDDPAILNWRRRSQLLTTSGQPDEAELGDIARLGVATVVNLGLHTHPRALPDEATSVAALGMRYVHIPVDFDAPTELDYAKFLAAMADAGDRPVHVHCILNARVSAFLHRYRRATIGNAESRAELESIWRPGGVWAAFLGDADAAELPHRYAGQDY